MDKLPGDFTGAEAVVNAEQHGPAPVHAHCLNCQTLLTGPYCANCGQRDLPRRQNIGDLIINFISSFWSFESKFFKTFGTLLLRPGRIVLEYNQGKRESYYHPARMYVFLSFVFFLLLALTPEEEGLTFTDDGKELTPQETKALLDSLDKMPGSTDEPTTVAAYDSLQNTLPVSERDSRLEQFFVRKLLTLREREGGNEGKLWQTFGKGVLENIPRMIFFLLPVVALLLKVLYWRRDFYYSEHLVFTVFYYDFMYLLGSLSLLFSMVSWLEWLSTIAFFYALFYLYKSMRRV
jgi:hypothetical protein